MELLWVGFLAFGAVLMLLVWRQVRSEAAWGRLGEVIGAQEGVRAAVSELKDTKRPRFLVRVARRFLAVQAEEELKQRLAHAGMSGQYTPEEFFAAKIAFGAVMFGVFSLLGMVGSGARAVVIGALFAMLGFVAPDVWLNEKARRRKAQIEKELLNFTDMLAVACEAGLSLQQAVERVASYQSSLLASEFGRAFRETGLGRPRKEALKEVSERNGVQELSELVTALVQAEEHGTPVAKVLRSFAAEMRNKRRNRAQEVVQKATVKMLFPVIFLIFVPMLVIMMGPALMNMLRDLGF
ncbi:MAG: type II secretion system F family protein [Bacillota bacterium]